MNRPDNYTQEVIDLDQFPQKATALVDVDGSFVLLTLMVDGQSLPVRMSWQQAESLSCSLSTAQYEAERQAAAEQANAEDCEGKRMDGRTGLMEPTHIWRKA